MEEMLVDQIVTAHWRLRRAFSAESGEIALSVDQGQGNAAARPEIEVMRWELSGDPISAMKDSAIGKLPMVARWLRDVRAHLVKDGELTSADCTAICVPRKSKHNVEENGGTACSAVAKFRKCR